MLEMTDLLGLLNLTPRLSEALAPRAVWSRLLSIEQEAEDQTELHGYT